MALYDIANIFSYLKCITCNEIPQMYIDLNNLSLRSICRNGHISNNLSFTPFNEYCIKNQNSFYDKCNKCNILFKDIENIFICLKCNKLYCNTCSKFHIKNDNHNNIIKYTNKYSTCNLHNSKNISICLDCKINLCKECLKLHQIHNIKSLIDIIPNKEKKESMNIKNKENESKIQKIIDNLKEIKNNLDKRYKKLEEYLRFLYNINKFILQNYNYSYHNYYNYEICNYFSNYINDEEHLKESKFYDFLINGNSLELDRDNQLKISQSKEENLPKEENNNITIYKQIFECKNLAHFKDNLYFSYEHGKDKRKYKIWTISLFKFNNLSFRKICQYTHSHKNTIDFIKESKYNNYLFINHNSEADIITLEYDSNQNEFNLLYKLNKNGQSFYDVINDINGNIITTDRNELSIWKKGNTKKTYKKALYFQGNYEKLFNVNNSIFMSIFNNPINNNKICFFSCENDKYQMIKYIDNSLDFNSVGVINNQILILMGKFGINIAIIDLNIFEIVQIIKTDKCQLFCQKNFLIKIYFNDDDCEILKEKFNFDSKEGTFTLINSSKNKLNLTSFSQMIFTKDEYCIFLNNSKINIIKV